MRKKDSGHNTAENHQKVSKALTFAGILLLTVMSLVLLFCSYKHMLVTRNKAIDQMLMQATEQVNLQLEEERVILDQVVSETEELLANRAGNAMLTNYFYEKADALTNRGDSTCIGVYCSNGKWQIMKDFHPDASYSPRERLWYVGASLAKGELYITSPYVDYRTGQFHYTMSRQLSDAKTVVSMDYTMDEFQQLVEQLPDSYKGQYMIVNKEGMIYAHSNKAFSGHPASDFGLDDIVRKVYAIDGQRLSLEQDGKKYTVYSQKMDCGWRIIGCVEKKNDNLYAAQTPLFLTLWLVAQFVLFVCLLWLILHKIRKNRASLAKKDEIARMSVKQFRYFTLLCAVFVVISMFFIGQDLTVRLSVQKLSMEKNANNYKKKVSEWLSDVDNSLTYIDYYMQDVDEKHINYEEISDMISKVLRDSDTISNIYVYNPSWEYSVIDEKKTYVDESEFDAVGEAFAGAVVLNGEISVTEPYTDKQYNVYCITLSKAIYRTDGTFFCTVCADCYLDRLINILGADVSEDGYVFLADGQTNIINHPYAAYQMRIDRVSRAADLIYQKAFLDDEPVRFIDYDGKSRYCRVVTDPETGFFIVTMENASKVRDDIMKTITLCMLVLTFGVVMIVLLMRLISKWQISTAKKFQDAADMANQSAQAKADFLANMSHEIRTPMNAIVGMCELILREWGISETVKEYCYNIQNSGRSLLSIINDILDFSKIESGKMELVEDEFDITSTLNDVINMAVARKGNKKLEIIVHVDPTIPVGLIGDEIRIRQIIINLVTNGIKYTNKGCVSIRVSQTKRDYGINLCVAVADTGIGITPENMEKLFYSFQQVDTKKNRAVEGTGLGLAISKRLVSRMGGFINVTSKYGKGSEFKFVIPLKVSNPKPFVTIKDADKVHAVGYINFAKYECSEVADEYRQLVRELNDNLHTEIKICDSLEDLKAAVKSEHFTHIFASREEYLQDVSFYEEEMQKSEVVIVQDREDAITVATNIKCLYKPFYILSVASVFNHENIYTNLNRQKDSAARFIAPKARVLVVDDNAINLAVAVGLMRPYRMQVITASSAKDAMMLLRSKDFHLIFMDHMMPEIDGVEATKLIRQMEGEYYQKVPIVALTANAVNGAREIFINAGMNDFLAKPIELSALDKVLKQWLPNELIQIPMQDSAQTSNGLEQKASEDVVPEGDELFNAKMGLFYTGGNVETYNKILETYLDKYEEKRAYIQKLFDEEEWKNYIIEVHSLKSTSMTIGSKELSERAKELELAGKQGDYKTIVEKNAALMELYGVVANAGREYLGSTDAGSEECDDVEQSTLTEVSLEKVQELVGQICEASEAFDGDAILELCKEAADYSFDKAALKSLFDDVSASAEDFEYEEAAAKAQAIVEKLKGGKQNA